MRQETPRAPAQRVGWRGGKQRGREGEAREAETRRHGDGERVCHLYTEIHIYIYFSTYIRIHIYKLLRRSVTCIHLCIQTSIFGTYIRIYVYVHTFNNVF